MRRADVVRGVNPLRTGLTVDGGRGVAISTASQQWTAFGVSFARSQNCAMGGSPFRREVV